VVQRLSPPAVRHQPCRYGRVETMQAPDANTANLNSVRRLTAVASAAVAQVAGCDPSDQLRILLHWLPVRQRVTFRLATLVHKCLNGQAPTYLADFCRQTTDRRSIMRSAETWKLHVPRATDAHTASDRSFAVAGPSIWNSLPPVIWDPLLSSQGFRRLPKKNLVRMTIAALVSLNWHLRNVLTYLLTYCYTRRAAAF